MTDRRAGVVVLREAVEGAPQDAASLLQVFAHPRLHLHDARGKDLIDGVGNGKIGD